MSGAPSTAAPRRTTRRRVVIVAVTLLAILCAAFGIYVSTGVLGDNVREVVPGKLYRSAQVSTETLGELIGEHHIACVLSLRKIDPPVPELLVEQEYLDHIGVAHDNVQLSPKKLPPPDALVRLLARFDAGPYPMLVHCEEGADRTGLAVVIWLVVHGGRSLADARASDLSWRNGHFSFGQAHAMDDFFDLYTSTSNGVDLRTWIRDAYPRLFEARVGPPRGAAMPTHDRG